MNREENYDPYEICKPENSEAAGHKRGEAMSEEIKGRCKDCKHFEYDSVTSVDGIPLIVGHEICSMWGGGCKTREDGYCFLFEKKAPIEQQTTDPLVEKLRSCKITEHLEEDLMIRGFNAGIERAIQEITGEDSI